MFADRMNTEKTRIVIDLSDATLLRLRTLLVVEHPCEQVSLSEYLEEYLSSTLDDYIVDIMNEEHGHVFDPVWRLLDNLCSTKTSCGDGCEELRNELPESAQVGESYIEGTC